MSINNNIWEVAEAWLNGNLPAAEADELKRKLESDTDFANEFHEITGMIRSMERSGKQRQFRAMLRDIHDNQEQHTRKGHLIVMTPQFWRTAAVAAGVAILTSAITIWSLNPAIRKHDSQYYTISREVGAIKKAQAQQQVEQDKLKEIVSKSNKPAPPPSDVKYTGTGFALTNDGYFVTADHVIHHDGKGFDSVYIQNQDGQYFKAQLIVSDATRDLAILKVDKKNFKFGKGELPYTFAKAKAGLGSRIFTLGYPTEDEVYSEGYISRKSGFEGDAQQYTLDLPVGHGQSGSPVVDDKGNIIGILTAMGGREESNTYAVSSTVLVDMLQNQMPEGKSVRLPKVNKLGRLGRDEQVEKIEPYTFSVKVYKK